MQLAKLQLHSIVSKIKPNYTNTKQNITLHLIEVSEFYIEPWKTILA